MCMDAEKIINIQTWHQEEYGMKKDLKGHLLWWTKYQQYPVKQLRQR